MTHDEIMKAREDAIRAAQLAARGGEDVLPSRPPGAFTAAEYAAMCDIPKDTGKAQLERLVEQGRYETCRAYDRIPDRNRRLALKMYRKKPEISGGESCKKNISGGISGRKKK